jgi:hypothetical protein
VRCRRTASVLDAWLVGGYESGDDRLRGAPLGSLYLAKKLGSRRMILLGRMEARRVRQEKKVEVVK